MTAMLSQIEAKLKAVFPAATIELNDYRHDGTHVVVNITSEKFKGLSLIDQHKLVYVALADMLNSGELHALKIKTTLPQATS